MADQHEPPLEGSAAQGREILWWIAQAAIECRKNAGVPISAVAALANVHTETVKRFEKVERFPEDLDGLMVAYAKACGLNDERDIYDRAMELWRKHHPSALSRLSDEAQPWEQILIDGARRAVAPAPAERGRRTTARSKRRASR